jgi:hypothetical protein
VDTTWGELQRLEAAPGVPTVGEPELVELVEQGRGRRDRRTAGSFGGRTIPGSINIPHTEMVEQRGELDPAQLSILFCNAGRSAPSRRTRSASGWRRVTRRRRWRTTAAGCTTG